MQAQKLFIFGLDRAGKTVITNYISKGVIDNNTKPSLSFTNIMLETPKVKIAIWDTPGQIKLRKMWLNNVTNAKLLVYVLDTSDAERFSEAKTELVNFIKSLYNFKAPMLFLFHKMDTPEGQKNLATAKALFDLEHIYIQRIFPMETSKSDVKSLDAFREKVIELLLKVETEDFERKITEESISTEAKLKAEAENKVKKAEKK